MGSQISWCLTMLRSVACVEKGKSLRDLIASRPNKVLLQTELCPCRILTQVSIRSSGEP